MFKTLLLITLFLSSSSLYSKAISKGKHYVNTPALKVRLAPTTQAKHSYSIYKNHTVRVHELKGSWARISRYKTTTVNGKFTKAAKWVYALYLTKNSKKVRTPSPKKPSPIYKNIKVIKKTIQPVIDKISSLEKIIKKSDNYKKHFFVFKLASQKLFDAKICTLRDFRRMRGWVESTPKNNYFIYCGGFKRKNKIYLNVTNGVMHR